MVNPLKYLLPLVALLAFAVPAHAQCPASYPVTPNYSLGLPPINTSGPGWGLCINADFSALDTAVGNALNAANAASQKVTAGSNPPVGFCTTGAIYTTASNSLYTCPAGTWTLFSGGGGGGTTTNALTLNNSGTGAASGTTFNGSAPVTLSYNTIGAAAANASTTVNSQACALGSSCAIPFQTNTVNNLSLAGINLLPSTANAVGLTVTPTNSSGNQEKFEITGGNYTGNAGTATKLSTNGSANQVWGMDTNGVNQQWNTLPVGGVIGGTFGANPSSGYTFTSTPITTNPFNGNFLIATATNPNCTSTYTAGSGFTLYAPATGACIGIETATGAAASSYTGAFTYGNSQTWSATISAWTTSGTPALIQGRYAQGGISSLAFTSNPTAGDLLIAILNYGSSHAPVTGVTGSLNTTGWKLIGLRAVEAATLGVGNGDFQEIWYKPNCLGGAAETVTFAGGAAGAISLIEISNIATSNPVVDYAYNPDSTGNTASTSFTGATTNNQYLVQAVNTTTGNVDFSGRDSAAVFRSALANGNLPATGGLIYFKNGVYPIQTCLQETNAGLSNYYCNGIAPPFNSTTDVSWHIMCESVPQVSYVISQATSCQHLVLPSAYSGSQPGNTKLSIFFQRPNNTHGAVGNNAVFMYGGNCRIPDNQRTATTCYDMSTTSYSWHDGPTADTALVLTNGTPPCTGITPAAANMVGFATNPSATDEAFFHNTWVVGFNTPYSAATNHLYGVNMHAVCNQNAGVFPVSLSTYGGELHHYQDIHNIVGPAFNCTAPGTRWVIDGEIEEDAITGPFARTTNASESVPGNCVGTVTANIEAAGGVAFNVHNYWASGSGINFRTNGSSVKLMQPGLVTSNFTSAATTGTTKQTLASYTFTFQTQTTNAGGASDGPFFNNPGAVFQIDAWGITAATANNKTLEIDFGGTAIATMTSAANNGSIGCSAKIIVSSVANTQEIEGSCTDSTGTKTFQRTAPGITGNANIVLNIAATTPTASGDFTFKGLTIENVGGN